MYNITRTTDRLEFHEDMPPAARVVCFLAAAFPLIAAYRFVMGASWHGIDRFSILAAAFALVLVGTACLFILVGLTALNKRIMFDFTTKTVNCRMGNFIRRVRELRHPFNDLKDIEVRAHAWTEGISSGCCQAATRCCAERPSWSRLITTTSASARP